MKNATHLRNKKNNLREDTPRLRKNENLTGDSLESGRFQRTMSMARCCVNAWRDRCDRDRHYPHRLRMRRPPAQLATSDDRDYDGPMRYLDYPLREIKSRYIPPKTVISFAKKNNPYSPPVSVSGEPFSGSLPPPRSSRFTARWIKFSSSWQQSITTFPYSFRLQYRKRDSTSLFFILFVWKEKGGEGNHLYQPHYVVNANYVLFFGVFWAANDRGNSLDPCVPAVLIHDSKIVTNHLSLIDNWKTYERIKQRRLTNIVKFS